MPISGVGRNCGTPAVTMLTQKLCQSRCQGPRRGAGELRLLGLQQNRPGHPQGRESDGVDATECDLFDRSIQRSQVQDSAAGDSPHGGRIAAVKSS